MSYGKAKGVKIKIFSALKWGLDEEVNEFLSVNPDIEIIEVQYSTCATKNHGEIHSTMVIYREKAAE